MPRVLALELTVLALLAGCASTPDADSAAATDPERSARQPITHGADDSDDPSVVAIVTLENAAFCTGTLIGPHTVLTAAHCQIGPLSYASYRVFFGSDVAGDGTLIDISDARIHPDFDVANFSNDLALLTLARAGPTPPVPIDPRTPDDSFVDQTFHAVGFGMTADGAGDQGRKRIGTATVSAVGELDFTTKASPSQPCVIDSGGPALFTDGETTYITGVVSHGDSNCTDHANYARIDVGQASFIQPYLAETAPGTAKPADRCLYAEQCVDSTCVGASDEPRITYCARDCGDGSPCPSGMVCTAVDGAGLQCRYPLPTPGAMGSSCTSDRDCLFSECNEKAVCSRRCVSGNNDCPSGFECTNLSGISFYCMPVPAPAPPGKTSSCALAQGAVRESHALVGLTCCALAALAIARRRRRP